MAEPRTDEPLSPPGRQDPAATSAWAGRLRALRFRWTLRTGSVAVLCAVALLAGGTIAARTTFVAPAPPAAVCGLVRPEFYDILVPGHAKPVAHRDSGR